MGRSREYENNAERQRAYRRRKAEEDERLRRTRRRGSKASKPVPAKLIKVLGLLGSDQAGERDTAARMATQMLKDLGLTWYDVLDVEK
jgi:hypothetical protein